MGDHRQGSRFIQYLLNDKNILNFPKSPQTTKIKTKETEKTQNQTTDTRARDTQTEICTELSRNGPLRSHPVLDTCLYYTY